MKNKIKKSVLSSLKGFNIIAYGNDNDITNRVLETIKTALLIELNDVIDEVNSNSHVAEGYVDGLKKSMAIIEESL